MDERERGIVAHIGVGKTTLSAVLHEKINEITKKDFDSFMIYDEKRENSIEINGEFYEPITNNRTNPNIANALFQRIELGLGRGSERKLPKGTNIIEEFRLIGLKQSTLTKWEREEVKRVFERNFNKVER